MRLRKIGRAGGNGFSLIELMVASTLSLILLAGVTGLVVSMSRTHKELAETSALADNGRHTAEVLGNAIRHAGFYGRFDNLDEDGTDYADPSLEDPCDEDLSASSASPGNLEDDLRLALQGYNNVTDDPALDCIADSNHRDDTDILVIRRAARNATAVDKLEADHVYLQGGVNGFTLDTALGETADDGDEEEVGDSETGDKERFARKDMDGNRVPIRQYRVDIYFVSPCSATFCGNASNDVPTLKRISLDKGPAWSDPEVVTVGVEQLQLDYGVDHNGDGAPDDNDGDSSLTVQNPSDVDAWLDVVTVNTHMLARATDPSTGYSDDASYELGLYGSVTPSDDKTLSADYKRELFTRTARVVNRSSRREVD